MIRRNDRTHTKQLFFKVIETKRIITFYFKIYHISCKKQWNVEFSINIKWGQIILEKNVEGATNI